MTDVFMNYHRADRELAEKIESVLASEGLASWRDESNLLAGEDYVSRIREALENAKCIVTLWTPRSVHSEWVIAEAVIGFRNETLVPIAVGVSIDNIPAPFSVVHTLTTNGDKIELNECRQLVAAVRRCVEARAKDDRRYVVKEPAESRQADVEVDQHVLPDGKKAFISYASEDEEAAIDLVKHLESAGCPCWISFRDVDPGEDYRSSILAAISQVKFLVLIHSAHANTSFDVANELLLARKRNKRRFVLKTDASEPAGPVEYELATVQWLDCQQDRSAAFEKIAKRAQLL